MGGDVKNLYIPTPRAMCDRFNCDFTLNIYFELCCHPTRTHNAQIHRGGAAHTSQPNNIDTSCRFQIGARLTTTFCTK